MSAIRNSGRRTGRSAPLPYARSWSITGFLNFLNPLRSHSPTEASSDSQHSFEFEEESFSSPASPAASLSRRGDQIAHDINTQGSAVLGSYTQQSSQDYLPSAPSSHLDSSTPAKNLESVSAQLKASLGMVGVEQLVSLLQEGKSTEETEPFRFTSSPSTPARGNSPFQGNTGFSFGSSAAQLSTPSPRKTLNRNPNGVYRWQGGGSAKTPRSKNRYSSPAFGPSRSTPDRLVLRDTQIATETPKTDTKRRRVGDEAIDSSFAPSGSVPTLLNGNVSKPPVRAAAPDPSPTRVKQSLPFPISAGTPTTPRTSNGITLNTNASPSSSRLRMPPVSQKLTSPVVPSPLRQAWSGGSWFHDRVDQEVTLPKRPDLSNPYQTASPVAKDDKGKGKDSSAEKEKIYSPQAIIEATLPKGSKRSRPPAHLEKMMPSTREVSPSLEQTPGPSASKAQVSSSNRYTAYVVEEIDEDDEEARRATKRSKPYLAGRGAPSTNGKSPTKPSSSPDIVIEEVDDIDMGSPSEKLQSIVSPPTSRPPSTTDVTTSGTAPARSAFSGLKSASAPKEPSKLRFSYQPEPVSSPAPPPPATLAPLPSPAPFTLSTTATAPSSAPAAAPFAFLDANKDAQKAPTSAKEAALAVPLHSLPTYSFHVAISVPSPSTPQQIKARNAAKSVPNMSLPKFDFSKEVLKTAPPVAKAPAVVAFNWSAAGSKPTAAASAGSSWTCSTCMLSNPASATDKCTICDTPR
ncbi:hypothetical protein FPV67DRAFT_1727406 [Lyophyllum atratum]|nr:hypothetical protein FPV67DRAFT_1727406 [Lyophyllum atratum]